MTATRPGATSRHPRRDPASLDSAGSQVLLKAMVDPGASIAAEGPRCTAFTPATLPGPPVLVGVRQQLREAIDDRAPVAGSTVSTEPSPTAWAERAVLLPMVARPSGEGV